jgi:hypothetical protein
LFADPWFVKVTGELLCTNVYNIHHNHDQTVTVSLRFTNSTTPSHQRETPEARFYRAGVITPPITHPPQQLGVVNRTKIPDPPIHFSGSTNFWESKNEFTNHQFETSVLEPPMSFIPLSNHQTVVNPRDSLNFNEGTITVSKFVGHHSLGT